MQPCTENKLAYVYHVYSVVYITKYKELPNGFLWSLLFSLKSKIIFFIRWSTAALDGAQRRTLGFLPFKRLFSTGIKFS